MLTLRVCLPAVLFATIAALPLGAALQLEGPDPSRPVVTEMDLLPPPIGGLPPLPTGGPIASATYVACGEKVGEPLRCSDPVAFGSPVWLDLDQDSGPEVQVLLSPLAAPVVGASDLEDPLALLEDLPSLLTGLPEEALVPGIGVTLQIGAVAPILSDLPCQAELEIQPEVPFLHHAANCWFSLQNGTNLLPSEADLLEGNLGDANLPARVFAVYQLADELTGGDSDTVIRLGVDGTATKLPETTTFRFRLEPEQLALGRAAADYLIDFDRPGSEVGVFAEFSQDDGSGQPIDPTTVSMTMTPVPDLQGRMAVAFDGTIAEVDLEATVPALLTVEYDSEVTDPAKPSTTHVEATFDKMPLAASVEYASLPAQGGQPNGTRVLYRGLTPIENVTGSFHRDDAGPAEQFGTIVVEDLPSEVAVELRTLLGNGSLNYDANLVVPRIAATFEITNKTGNKVIGNATVHDLPTRLDAAWNTEVPAGEPMRITYDASDSFGPLDFDLNTGPGALAIDAHVESLPPFVEARFTTDYVEMDARSSAAAAPASDSMGAAHVRFATDGYLFSSQLPGDDYAEAFLANGAVSADVQYTGLRALRVDARNAETEVEVKSAERRVLNFRAAFDDIRLRGVIDRVPSHVDVSYTQGAQPTIGNVIYDAHGETIDEVQVEIIKLAPFANFQATVQSISGDLDLDFDLDGDVMSLDFVASSPVGPVHLDACIDAPVGACNTGLEVVADASSIPGEVHVDVENLTEGDVEKYRMYYEASGTVDALGVEFRDAEGVFNGTDFKEVVADLTDAPTKLEVFLSGPEGLIMDTFGQGSVNGRFLAHRDLPMDDLPEANFVRVFECTQSDPCTNGLSGLEGALVKVSGLTKLVLCAPPECAWPDGTDERMHAHAEFLAPTNFRMLYTYWTGNTPHDAYDIHVDDMPTMIDLTYISATSTYWDHKEENHGDYHPLKTQTLKDIDYSASGNGHLKTLKLPLGNALGGKHITFSDATMGPGLHVDFDSLLFKMCDYDDTGDDDYNDAMRIGIASKGNWSLGKVAIWSPKLVVPDAGTVKGNWVDVTGVVLRPGAEGTFEGQAYVCMAPDGTIGQIVVSGDIELNVWKGRLEGEIRVGSTVSAKDQAGTWHTDKLAEDVFIDFCDGGWRGYFLANIDDGAILGVPEMDVGEVTYEGDFGIEITDPIGDHPGCGIT